MTRNKMRRQLGAAGAALLLSLLAGCGHSEARTADAAPGVTPPASATPPPPPMVLHQGAGALRARDAMPKKQ